MSIDKVAETINQALAKQMIAEIAVKELVRLLPEAALTSLLPKLTGARHLRLTFRRHVDFGDSSGVMANV